MRFISVAAFLMLIAAIVPTQANAQAAQGIDMGGMFCRQHFSCNQGASVDQLIAIAGSCSGHAGGSTNVFNEAAGLDANNCLTPSDATLQSPSSTVPHCCVVQVSGSDCALHCSAVTK